MVAPLKPRWGLWLFMLLVSSGQPNAVTANNGEIDDGNSNGALVAVETEDDEETDITTPTSREAFGRDVYDPDVELFHPTHEWQTVKQGQAIPAGLHVQLDMQTGERRAKLMDGVGPTQALPTDDITPEGSPDRVQRMKDAIQQAMKDLEDGKIPADDTNLNSWKQDGQEGMKVQKEKRFSRDELKDALKKFKAETGDEKDKVKRKFRSMEELKKEFADMNVVIKTDLEILTELVDKYKQPDLSEDQIRTILKDLEYYLHQIDNAQNFVTLGGLRLIMRDLNHTSEVIRSETALVLGSSVQGNPKVQVASMDAGAMEQLVRMSSLEPSSGVRSHVLYALSALIRHFPYAQQRFLQLGGMHSLKGLFSQPDTAKLRLRAVTLINDMLLEQKATLQQQTSSDPTEQEKIKQYQSIRLAESLEEHGWCDLVPTLLSLPEHDSREKVLHAMSTLVTLCHHSFTDARPLLTSLRSEYQNLALTETDEGDTFFKDMSILIDSIMEGLYSVKTEL